MSSTTSDHTDGMRGQVLVIFALSLTVLLGAGALAFDGGMMILERRDQQNAADAAAMAGSRYVTTDHATARSVAASIAAANGFSNGSGMQVVNVNIPPTSGQFATWPNAIQVEITNTRPSILGAVMGFLNWPVSASATAASLDEVGGPFSIVALEEHECEALKVAGTGGVVANGNIQVNSDCPSAAMKRQAGGTIAVTAENSACNVVGGIQNEGGDLELLKCLPVSPAPFLPDPLVGLPSIMQKDVSLPYDMVQEGGKMKIPNGCPGSSSPATFSSPATCQFPANYKDTAWRLFPGAYPGGLKLLSGNFYLEPGVYWLGGGGLAIGGNGSFTKSVKAGAEDDGGGVLFYNTAMVNSPLGAMKLDGSSANIQLLPLEPTGEWESLAGLVIYQDRLHAFDGDDLTINGNDSLGMSIRGTIYLPQGDVKVNGNEGDLVMDQVIARTFDALGNGGDILALKDEDNIYKFTAAGLIE